MATKTATLELTTARNGEAAAALLSGNNTKLPTIIDLNVNKKNGHLLPAASVHTQLTFKFCDVNYSVKKSNSKTIRILNGTWGEFKSGRITAVLGPSGAGKSSMMNVLSGFKINGVTGQFLLNDKPRDLLTFRDMCSYIPQVFEMLDLLTVQETIRNSTDLKLPEKISKAEKLKIIDDIIKLLNMEKCRNTLVCKISGGERKRLSIAIELVTNPPLMFFDEPTSGLDSVASLQIMTYLHRLARNGRIIVCVLHQPSSRLMQLFDDVMVMSGGGVLYCGGQEHMLSRFGEAGYICPQYYNPADFVLEVSSEEPNEQIKLLLERNKAQHSLNTPNSGEPKIIDEKTQRLPKQNSLQLQNDLQMDKLELAEQKNEQSAFTFSEASAIPKSRVSVWRQYNVLFCRSLLTMFRNRLCVQLRFLMHMLVAAFLGLVFWDIGNDAAKILTNTSCLFFVSLFIFFGNTFPSILLCPQDTLVFVREYLNGWYSLYAYYAAKITSELPMLIICPTIFVSIIYFMTGQPCELGRFSMYWGIALLTVLIAHLMGLVFGAIVHEHIAFFMVPALSIPLMVFSGFFIRMHELMPVLQPLCDISFFRYIMEGLTQAVYGYERGDLECKEPFCYFKSTEKFLKELDMWGDLYGRAFMALLIWVVFLLIAFFFGLRFRTKRMQ